MRKYPLPAAIAAAHAARASRLRDAGVPLYLPSYDEKLSLIPLDPAYANEDHSEVDASGITVGGDEDDLL